VALHLLLEQGAQPGGTALALAVLLTHALHAVVWTLAAAGLARGWPLSSDAQNTLWRLAVFAPPVTTSLACVMSARFHAAATAAQAAGVRVAWLAYASELAPSARAESELWTILGTAAAVCLLLGLLRWLAQALRLAHRLRARTPVNDARWLERLERLRWRTRLGRVALTQSPDISSPLVLGAAQICIPEALLTLGNADIDSVLAHELAHLERRDGFWFPFAGVLAALTWLNPLSAWVVARFRQTAEQACDDRAVSLTQDALGLARVLVQLASSAQVRLGAPLTPTMANGRGALVSRVERLTTTLPASRGSSPRHAARLSTACCLVLGLASAGLGVRVAAARPQPTPGPDLGVDTTLESRSTELAELARRAAEVRRQMAHAASLDDAERAGSPSAVRLLELRQELRHLDQARQWLEERFIAEETGTKARAEEKRR